MNTATQIRPELLNFALARRSLLQMSHAEAAGLSDVELQALRVRGGELASSFDLRPEQVTQAIVEGQQSAARSIANVWPNSPRMQLIARHTLVKAELQRTSVEDDEGESANGERHKG